MFSSLDGASFVVASSVFSSLDGASFVVASSVFSSLNGASFVVASSVFSSLNGASFVVASSVDVVVVSLDESIFDYFCHYHSLYYLEKYFPYDFLQLLLLHRQHDQNQSSTN